MENNDIITIEKALQIAKFCYGAGFVKGYQTEDVEGVPDMGFTYFIAVFSIACEVLGIAEHGDVSDWMITSNINWDKAIEAMNTQDINSFMKVGRDK